MSRIVTFYSYKGGVGRTFALANIAVLLAKRGLKVLAMDWDLDAPGLQRYFERLRSNNTRPRGGLIQLLAAALLDPEVPWQSFVEDVRIDESGSLSLMTSGDEESDYAEKVRAFSWSDFFERHQGGTIIDRWRSDWISQYDFVLIDSRTGVTDVGGVCTVLLPDTLVLVFAANDQSFHGGIRVAYGVQRAREELDVPRPPAAILPLPGRFDGRDEVDLAAHWLNRFADDLKPFYDVWLPKQYNARDLLELTKVPYVTKFSFGEPLVVLTHSTRDPELPGYYLENATRLLASSFGDAGKILDPEAYGSSATLASILALNSNANRLRKAGDLHAAASLLQKSASESRRLAGTWPEFEAALAVTLNDLSNDLRNIGDRGRALKAITESVELYRGLIAKSPDTFEAELAGSLTTLSNALGDTGDRSGALEAIEQSVEEFRRINAREPGNYERDLAIGLNNLSNRLSEMGDHSRAVKTIEEAVAIYRRLAAKNPDEFDPYVAESLTNLCSRLGEGGDPIRAKSAIDESIEIYRQLAVRRPGLFDDRLAAALNNQSVQLTALRDSPGALRAAKEAVEIYRRLAATLPAAFEPCLANSLNTLSHALSETGNAASALETIEEAVQIRRKLAEAEPAAFELELAGVLNTLSVRLRDQGDLTGSLRAINESVDIYRRLSAQGAPLFHLAGALNNQSNVLSETANPVEALESIKECVAIYRDCAKAEDRAYAGDLVRALCNLALRLADAGDIIGARRAVEEASEVWQRCATAVEARDTDALVAILRRIAWKFKDVRDERTRRTLEAIADNIQQAKPEV